MVRRRPNMPSGLSIKRMGRRLLLVYVNKEIRGLIIRDDNSVRPWRSIQLNCHTLTGRFHKLTYAVLWASMPE